MKGKFDRAMVKIGVVGCGAVHSTHCDAIEQIAGAEIAGVFDTVRERACATSERRGVPAFEDLQSLLNAVDVVTICVPSGLHAEVGIGAANAGKHVLVEKPIDVSLEAATALVETCRDRGVKLGTISQHRFANSFLKLRDAVQSGELGKIVVADAAIKWYRTQAYYDSGDWRGTWKLDGGGCLINQGVHYVDMIQWVMGGVKSVQAQMHTATHDIEVEDVVTALVEYRNGAIGTLVASTSCYPGLAERIEVHGEYGSVVIEGDAIKLWQADEAAAKSGLYGGGVMHQPTPSVHVMDAGPSTTGAADPSAIWGEQHRLQIEDFVRAVDENRDPAVTGEMALEPLRVILAIYGSARRGGARVEVGA